MELTNQNLRENLQKILNDLNEIFVYCSENKIDCYIEDYNFKDLYLYQKSLVTIKSLQQVNIL